MKVILPILIAAAWPALGGIAPARAAGPVAAAPMTSTGTRGEVSIVPEPRLVNGELILKVVALNQAPQAAAFGPEDIRISTADGKSVPLMSLDALIAQVKANASAGTAGSAAYESSYTGGATTTYGRNGQPDVHNFTGSSQSLGGQVNPEAPVSAGAPAGSAALQQRVASLEAGILQDITIGPGEVKGGEVVTQRIRFHWREKHALHIEVRFNGEQHEFDLAALPED